MANPDQWYDLRFVTFADYKSLVEEGKTTVKAKAGSFDLEATLERRRAFDQVWKANSEISLDKM